MEAGGTGARFRVGGLSEWELRICGQKQKPLFSAKRFYTFTEQVLSEPRAPLVFFKSTCVFLEENILLKLRYLVCDCGLHFPGGQSCGYLLSVYFVFYLL